MSENRRHRQSLQASALIVCLLLIVLVTMLVVGFMTTARMEQATVAAHRASHEATLYARMGSDVARAKIAEATAEATPSASPEVQWTTGPGRIFRYTSGEDEPEEVPLFSGEASAEQDDIAVNLNPQALTHGNGVILAAADQVMAQQWIYIRQDGTFSAPGVVPSFDSDNPVIGRFAFWADDASSRVNVNTAWTRRSANTLPQGHPSKVDLGGAPGLSSGSDVDQISSVRTNHGGFPTVQEIKGVSAAAADAYDAAPEAFTHYNHASLLNPFGQPRYFLTTQQSKVVSGENNFFDILKTPNTDPGKLTALDNTKVQNLFAALYALLARTDWPVEPGRSFVQKYGQKGTAQIVLNLIEYVRSAESSAVMVEPIRGTFNAANGTFKIESSASSNSLIGNSRRPLITEMAILVPENKTTEGEGENEKSYYLCTVYIEIHLPASAGGQIRLVADQYQIHIGRIVGGGDANEARIVSGEVVGSEVIQPGEYRTVRRTLRVPAEGDYALEPPTQLQLRVALSQQISSSPVRLDIAPIATTGVINYTGVPGAPENALQSVAIDDPYVKGDRDDWTLGPQTFGAPPANRALGNAPSSATLRQDLDADGNVTDHSVRFPTPDSGISGVGALGAVHSGMVGSGSGAGVPWRTLRFQPSGTNPQMLPDWAMLELFATPMGSAGATTGIYPLEAGAGGFEARGGLVNLNSALYPFKDGGDDLIRDTPLRMVLKNATGFTSDALLNAAVENLTKQVAADNGKLYGSDGSYRLPGEVAEVKGIADLGEVSEAAVGDIIEQLTTRSTSFIIYSIGEKVRQNAAGEIVSQGQRRMLTLVEKRGDAVEVVYEEELGL